MAQSCRGDCEADCIREGVIYSTLLGLHYGTSRVAECLRTHTALPRWASSVTLHPYCAPTLGNRTRLNHSLSFTIPPAWLRHAVPPLHKGGCGVPPLSYCAAAPGRLCEEKQRKYGCPDTGPARRRRLFLWIWTN